MKQILAIGGGGFMMEDAPSPIDRYILKNSGKNRPRICYLSTPSGDLPEHIEKFYAAYSTSDCEPSNIAFFRRQDLSNFREQLLSQDVIFVGGGNTKSALAVWREWGIDDVLRQAYHAGVLLAGMSAGALCWFEVGLTDSFGGNSFKLLPCLNFLPGACSAHWHGEPNHRPQLFAALKEGKVCSAIAIDDYAAALYENGILSQTVVWHDEARVYQVSRQGENILEVPCEFTFIGND
jgi:dipeptidase E